MKKYIVFWHAGMVGTDMNSGVIEWDGDPDILIGDYYSEAEEWFWNFNDQEDYTDIEPEIDIWWEEYDPDKHDGVL